ncbi:MAG: hypothetical protein IT449_03150 [Phycisphaerales bacterium]|nr:hypothetical protein [Phycisphaerales bacterium]
MTSLFRPRRILCVCMLTLAACALAGCTAQTGLTDDEAGAAVARDLDGDGVLNDVDLCAATPAGEAADASGCATSQLDSDQDGVSNALDACADTPDGLEIDADGCTRVLAWKVEADPFVSALLDLVPAQYELDSAGTFQQAQYEADGLVALLNLLGGLGGLGGGAGGDVEIEARIIDESALLGERTTLVAADVSGGDLTVEGTLGVIVELTQFDVQFAEGAVTWSFDANVELSVSGLLVLSEAHFVGTATGVLAADGSSITWTAVTGTLTGGGDALNGEEQTLPLEEVYVLDENDPEAGLMPRWTLAAE